jgi:hypothetical protein
MPLTGPLGLTPFALAPPVPGVDAPSGRAVLSRFISPEGDYQLDAATGQFAYMPPNRQRVVLSIGTERGSSAVLPNLGTKSPKVQGAQFVRATQNDLRRAAQPLVDDRSIRIRDIPVQTGAPAGRSETTFEYEDLTLPQQSPARKDTVETPPV